MAADFDLTAMCRDGVEAMKYPAHMRAMLVSCVIALLIGTCAVATSIKVCKCPPESNWFRFFIATYFLGFHGCMLNFAFCVATLMIMVRVADSWHVRSACGCATCLLLAAIFRGMRLLREGLFRDLGCSNCPCARSSVHSFLQVAGHLPMELVFLWVSILIWERIRNCERALLIDVGANKLKQAIINQFGVILIFVPFWLTFHSPDNKTVWIATSVINVINNSLVAAWAIEAYRRVEVLLGPPLLHSRQPTLVDEVAWAKATLHFQKLGVVTHAAAIVFEQATTIVWYVYLGLGGNKRHIRMAYTSLILVPWTLKAICTCMSLLMLTGTLFASSDEQRASTSVVESRLMRRKLRKEAIERWCPNEDPEWQMKVEELASRGVRLRSLLRFYKGLGKSYMLNFNPRKHKTTDVVRAVIIPMSKDKGSCALVLEGGPRRPHFMVTHNWENLFRDLVAAVVADALGDTEYGRIGELLESENGVEALEGWLGKKRDALDKTYWVCAFAVNQHKGICHANQGRADTVSGEPHAICDCGVPKHMNTTPPLLADGRSIGCEMNKFKDMMSFLASTDIAFAQVVAVDKKYELFDRAWCVCELAQASEAGMTQRLKIADMMSLEANECQLRNLKVENMQASRREDVEEILAGIPDVPQFNQKLQRLIFDDTSGLISACRRQDTRKQMAHIGRLARWQFATRQLLRRSRCPTGVESDGSTPPARAG